MVVSDDDENEDDHDHHHDDYDDAHDDAHDDHEFLMKMLLMVLMVMMATHDGDDDNAFNLSHSICFSLSPPSPLSSYLSLDPIFFYD